MSPVSKRTILVSSASRPYRPHQELAAIIAAGIRRVAGLIDVSDWDRGDTKLRVRERRGKIRVHNP